MQSGMAENLKNFFDDQNENQINTEDIIYINKNRIILFWSKKLHTIAVILQCEIDEHFIGYFFWKFYASNVICSASSRDTWCHFTVLL
jgi:hypothetical protein